MSPKPTAKSRRTRTHILSSSPVDLLEDRTLLSPQLVSKADPSGIPVSGNGDSIAASISDDGRYMVYVTTATNVKAGTADANGDQDVYLYDSVLKTTTLVSHQNGSLTTAGNGKAGTAVISGNGRYIAFSNDSTNLIAGQTDANTDFDLFLYDRTNGSIVLISHSSGSASTTANNGVRSMAISDDGRFVVYTSEATNLVTGQTDANGGLDVFLWDRNLGTSKLISHASGSETTASDGTADELVSIDQTGAKVVFSSSGTNISSSQNDSNGGSDVFVNSTSVNGNTLVSRSSSSSTTTANGTSQGGRISGDGKWIVYASLGTNIVSGVTDSNGGLDVFLFEFQTVTNRLVSRNQLLSNQTANDASTTQLAIDATGSKIAYVSKATDLVSGQVDAGNSLDVFFYDRNLGGSGLVSSSSTNASTTASGASSNPTISDNGKFIVYESLGSNIVSSQSGTPGVKNIFRFDTVPAKNTLLSFATTGVKVGGNGNSVLPMISGSGNRTLWTSVASNQIANDTNGFADAFFDGSPVLDMVGVKRGTDFYEDLDGNQIYNSSDVKFTFGNSTDIPVVGDWDGDGYDNIGVFRNGVFYLDLNGNRIWDAVGGGDLQVTFGITNDIPVIGDWNGDGRDDVGVKRGSSWYLDLNGNRVWNGTGGGDAAFSFGNPLDKPVIGDWNGDGKDKVGIYRNTGFFLLDQNGNRVWDGNITDSYFGFGLSTDRPVSGDWNQDGIDEIGVVRGNQWYLDRNGNRSWNGGVIDLTFSFGNPTDTPIVGRWAPKGFVASSAAAAPLSIQVSAPSASAEQTTPIVPLETQIDVSLLGTVRKSKGTSIES